MAPDVSELMGKDCPELIRCEVGESRERDEDHRRDEPHDHRCLRERALQEPDGPVDPELSLD